MKYRVSVTLLALMMGTFPLLSGCSTVIEKIQQTTGNNVEKVETKVSSQQHKKPEKTGEEKNLLPPAPATDLKNILKDDGKGRYAGEKYNKTKVLQALAQMPKGMSEEQIYAYLLGLVGENYKIDDKFFEQLNPNYQAQLNSLKSKTKNASSKKANVIVLINGSESMQNRIDGNSKLQAAKLALAQFAASLPKDTTLSIHVFGHQGSTSSLGQTSTCQRPETVYSKQSFDAVKFATAMSRVNGSSSYSPLAQAIRSTYEGLANSSSDEKNIVLLITDQVDQCGGDPVREAEEVRSSDKIASFNILGVKVDPSNEVELKKTANIAGGAYYRVTTSNDLRKALFAYQKEIHRMNAPWQLQALEKITQSYQADNKMLKEHYQGVIEKLNLEYERLGEANNYIKDLQKVTTEEWKKVGEWIDSRFKQVGDYMDEQWKTVGTELDNEWKSSVDQLEEEWKQTGKPVEEFNKHKDTLLSEHTIEDRTEQVQVENETTPTDTEESLSE
ncbi:VWA domain-containing protein [Thermoflavimicrobium dichotomicum]|uniref:von Willebrand factor type A domain-containing protein n=1 Tax=Thermoflavimicrobium dichotomicum TaxID=46223 RepID=A0A1I3MDY3_9BACL|nr:VWA domain-containing protein [Thermoflavimicrobium dichotomicum]SFI95183.1 von Willebrand factor type A domain-containing protein [Thermoflavimicrobium dichotomicum]